MSMRDTLPNPDFIIQYVVNGFFVFVIDYLNYNSTGDMSAHHLPDSRFTAINDTIAIINAGFPLIPIYPTLGNNDCYPDYYLNYWKHKPNDWLEKVWSSWSEYSAIPSDQKTNFINAGYYVVQHSPNFYIISLNTIYVCAGHHPDWNTDKHPDPAGQFAWLNSTLQSIENENAK